MASQGPNSPATASGWVSSNNVFASDAVYATSQMLGASTTSPAFLSVTNFSFSVPSGATINGIVAEIQRKIDSTVRNPRDDTVKLIKGGLALGTDHASASVWPTTEAYATYGTSSDLWGLTLADTDVNASNFGVRIGCKRDAGGKGTTTCSIDHVRITVYYTSVAAPAADFSGAPLSGKSSLSVVFTDSSSNTPTSWLWEKNDGSGWVNFAGTPTSQNPTESFATGTWSVRLTATNAGGSDTKTQTNYLTARASDGKSL